MSFYNFFIKMGGSLESLFLLYMRITWGHQFFILGVNKLHSIDHIGNLFYSLSIPAPIFHAYLVALIEIICGSCLFMGFACRLTTIPLIITMLVALGTAHGAQLAEGRFLMEPLSLVREAPYPFLITSLLVFIFGPGKISVDAWLKRWVQKHARY